MGIIKKNILDIIWELTAPGTEFPPYYCAWIGFRCCACINYVSIKTVGIMNIHFEQIVGKNTTYGTEFLRIFYARFGPLQLDFVLV